MHDFAIKSKRKCRDFKFFLFCKAELIFPHIIATQRYELHDVILIYRHSIFR